MPVETLTGYNRQQFLKLLGTTALVGLAPHQALLSQSSKPFNWRTLDYKGREYVPAEDIKGFYGFSQTFIRSKTAWFHSKHVVMKNQLGSEHLYINDIKFVLSYPSITRNGRVYFSRTDLSKLVDPILRPNFIRPSHIFESVVLDPGHGGHDSGAVGRHGYEKNHALDLAKRVRKHLSKHNIRAYLTRDSDEFISLDRRVRIANAVNHSIFVSLHFNSGHRSASGVETFALTPQGAPSTYSRSSSSSFQTGNRQDAENIALATAVHSSVIRGLKPTDRGIKRARFAVLTGILRPAILFEGGFLTHATEETRVANPTYRDLIANYIAQGISNYRKALHRRR